MNPLKIEFFIARRAPRTASIGPNHPDGHATAGRTRSPTPSRSDRGRARRTSTPSSRSKRRGFIFPSSEIYGGINAVWDYGPLGVELKNNVKRAWWRAMVQERDDIVGLDAGILMHPQVWVTSGHVGSFSDPLVECARATAATGSTSCPAPRASPPPTSRPDRHRALRLVCPNDGGPLSPPRRFNLMFQTYMGPVQDDASIVYFRPETAQGSYVNFKNVQQSSRKKIPFGIAQIGKSFRNEISPGNFVFRMREFEQMEMQYFVRPGRRRRGSSRSGCRGAGTGTRRYGVTPSRLRFREHAPDELAHYAKKAIDVEYRFPFGWKELEGIHNRGDFDLSRHQAESGENLEYFDPATEEHFIPCIVETAGGRGPGGVHVPHRRLSRGGGPGREAGGPRAAPRARAVQGRRAAAAQEAAGDRRAVPPLRADLSART